MSKENKLPPEESIRQLQELLKRLEKEKQEKEKLRRGKIIVKGKEDQLRKEIISLSKEIEETKKGIREAEDEIRGQLKWKEKVPIAEAAKEDLEGLSEEGKATLKALRGMKEKKTGMEESVEEKATEEKVTKEKGTRKYDALEETVLKEQRILPKPTSGITYGISPEQQGVGVAYGVHTQKPLGELYQEASALRKSIEEKGYVSQADERKAEYFTAAVQERMQAAEEGMYSLSEQAARAASLTQMIGQNIQQSYHGKKRNEWYQ